MLHFSAALSEQSYPISVTPVGAETYPVSIHSHLPGLDGEQPNLLLKLLLREREREILVPGMKVD